MINITVWFESKAKRPRKKFGMTALLQPRVYPVDHRELGRRDKNGITMSVEGYAEYIAETEGYKLGSFSARDNTDADNKLIAYYDARRHCDLLTHEVALGFSLKVMAFLEENPPNIAEATVILEEMPEMVEKSFLRDAIRQAKIKLGLPVR